MVNVLRILLGVFTLEYKSELRQLLRESYMKLKPPNVDVVFVIGKPTANYTDALKFENATHGDIMTLDCQERMNEGKSFDFFRRVHQTNLHNPYSFTFKGDDDAIYHLYNLEKKLSDLNDSSSVYLGALTRCNQCPVVKVIK